MRRLYRNFPLLLAVLVHSSVSSYPGHRKKVRLRTVKVLSEY